jgi:hypothetical protein
MSAGSALLLAVCTARQLPFACRHMFRTAIVVPFCTHE